MSYRVTRNLRWFLMFWKNDVLFDCSLTKCVKKKKKSLTFVCVGGLYEPNPCDKLMVGFLQTLPGRHEISGK